MGVMAKVGSAPARGYITVEVLLCFKMCQRLIMRRPGDIIYEAEMHSLML